MRRALVVAGLVVLVGCAKRSDRSAPGQAPAVGCTMRSAAQVAYITDSACPTPAKLVADKRLSGSVADPWGHDFVILCDGDDVRVESSGPDGKGKTPDDVVYDAHSCNVLH